MMSKAIRKPSTGEIIATSANQIVRPTYKNVVLYSPDPLSSCSVEGGSGDETTKNSVKHRQPSTKVAQRKSQT